MEYIGLIGIGEHQPRRDLLHALTEPHASNVLRLLRITQEGNRATETKALIHGFQRHRHQLADA